MYILVQSNPSLQFPFPTDPVCLSSPPYIRNAEVIAGDGRTSVLYQCSEGFIFSDGRSTHASQCQQDDSWSLAEAVCQGQII